MLTSRNFIVASIALISALTLTQCQSKSPKEKAPSANAKNESAAAAPSLLIHEIEGQAFSIDGQSVKPQALTMLGENRKPVFLDASHIAFASRRAGLERWQVFAVDLERSNERRISFDAGDAVPVTALGRRLLIASSSEERKSSDRVLTEYRNRFATPGASPAPTPSPDSTAPAILTPSPDSLGISLKTLQLERPAKGRRGTEWDRVSREAANRWTVTADRDLKSGLAIQQVTGAAQAYRLTLTGGKNREPDVRSWSPLKVIPPIPLANAPASHSNAVRDGVIFPDGQHIVWSNGAILWTTNLKGEEPLRLGDDAVSSPRDLAVDPSGEWIVFSNAPDRAAGRGIGLTAIHRSGRCLKSLTEIPGDEVEAQFSPDGESLLFVLKQGDISTLAKMPFGAKAAVAAAAATCLASKSQSVPTAVPTAVPSATPSATPAPTPASAP